MATATTPLLPVGLSGPAYFVSYGDAKFPELVVVLQGDGVILYLHGETSISKAGITARRSPRSPTRRSAASSSLPGGTLLGTRGNGDLCTSKLTMPTEFLAQNGARLKQNTKIGITGCPPAHPKAVRQPRLSAQRPPDHLIATGVEGPVAPTAMQKRVAGHDTLVARRAE